MRTRQIYSGVTLGEIFPGRVFPLPVPPLAVFVPSLLAGRQVSDAVDGKSV